MDGVKTNPYLFFKGNCREAMEFYKGVLGGSIEYSNYDDMPGMAESMPGGEELKGKVMHASLTGGDVDLMASDTLKASDQAAKVAISLSGTDEAKLRKIFDGLSAGGKVDFPLEKAPWGDIFGSFHDKYGLEWMVNVTVPKTAS